MVEEDLAELKKTIENKTTFWEFFSSKMKRKVKVSLWYGNMKYFAVIAIVYLVLCSSFLKFE